MIEQINLIILFFLLLSIVLGYLFKANIGIFAIVLCFIAAYIYGLKPNEIVKLWGLDLFFILVSITYFYGFVINNGTLNNLASKAVYGVRNYPWRDRKSTRLNSSHAQ